MKNIENKRKSRREECFVPVEGKTGDLFEQIVTTDISKTGMGFISPCEIPVNKEIPIEIDFEENGEPVFVIGKVKWVKALRDSGSFRLGLNFETVVRGSKTRLNKYLS